MPTVDHGLSTDLSDGVEHARQHVLEGKLFFDRGNPLVPVEPFIGPEVDVLKQAVERRTDRLLEGAEATLGDGEADRRQVVSPIGTGLHTK